MLGQYGNIEQRLIFDQRNKLFVEALELLASGRAEDDVVIEWRSGPVKRQTKRRIKTKMLGLIISSGSDVHQFNLLDAQVYLKPDTRLMEYSLEDQVLVVRNIDKVV